MKTFHSPIPSFARKHRPVVAAGLIAFLSLGMPGKLLAAWDWPWKVGADQTQLAQARWEQTVSERRAKLAEQQKAKAQQHARILGGLSLTVRLLGTGFIMYLLNNRTVVQKVIKNEIIQKVEKKEVIQKVVRQEVIVRSPAQDLVTDSVVIDGLNLIYGSSSTQTPTFSNVFGLILELQGRGCAFKCFFDANTIHKLRAGNTMREANIFRKMCRDFPDQFVVVPGGNRADDFILDYAHRHGTPIISNDRYRNYEQAYAWLKFDAKRRVSFATHSGMVQIIPLGICATIPADLEAADSKIRAGLGNPVRVQAIVSSGTRNDCEASFALAAA